MKAPFIITHFNRDLIKKVQKDHHKYINFFIDVRSVVPMFFDDKLTKLIINDASSMDIYIRSTLYNFFSYVDRHLYYAMDQKLVPRFFFFSDQGESTYHKKIDKDYKANRSHSFTVLSEEEYLRSKQLINGILMMFSRFISEIPGIYYIHLDYLESDFIPYYILSNYNFGRNDINIIKSRDKDLAQCLSLKPDTYQYFIDRQGKVILSDKDAINYHFKVKDDIHLPSNLVSLILAIAGDSADNVIGIKGIGYKKIVDFLYHCNDIIDWSLDNFENLNKILDLDENQFSKKTHKTILSKLKENKDLIEKNLKLTDFKYLCENLPLHHKLKIDQIIKRSDYPLLEDFKHVSNFMNQLKEVCNNDQAKFTGIKVYLNNLIRARISS